MNLPRFLPLTLLLLAALVLPGELCRAQVLGADGVVERDMKEITVRPKRQRYRRKGNPAVELMRHVIDAKADHDIHANPYASYFKYQRATTAFTGISREALDSLRLFQKDLFRRQVEYCQTTQKYILPFNYAEKVWHHLHRAQPSTTRDYLIGENVEGLSEIASIGDVANDLVENIFTDVNIYDNTLTIFSRNFTSPLSSRAAISFFQFFIEDTVVVDNQEVIRLSFVPQNPQDFGFSGRINILNDSTYRVQQCTLRLPLRSSVNYVNNMILEQHFTDLPNGQRVLARDDLYAELGILKRFKTLLVHRATSYTAFSLDSLPPSSFTASDHLRQGDRVTKDTTFWQTYRTDTLTRAEATVAAFTDSLNQASARRVWPYLVNSIINNHFQTSLIPKQARVEIGPIMNILSHNFIDGWRLRLGAQTTAKLFPHLRLKGYVAYGFGSQRWYGLGEVEYSFLRKDYSFLEFPRHAITAQWRREVLSPADLTWQHGRDKDNIWVSLRTSPVDHMMFMDHFQLAYEYETNQHLDIKLQAKHGQQTPCGALFYRTLAGEDIPSIKTSEFLLSLRWAPGEKITHSAQRRHLINRNNPILTLSHTTGLPGILGSRYRSNITEFTAYERLWLNSYGTVTMQLRASAQWNRVPFPFLIMPVANNSYIITKNMFQMIDNMEFINDRYLSFEAEWDISGKLLNRIPGINRLKLRGIVGFRMLYGHLTDANNPDLHPGDTYLYEFPSRDGQCIVHPMNGVPYMEFNFGLHNIFKIIRIDYVYRANYHYANTKRHGVRFCLEFNF